MNILLNILSVIVFLVGVLLGLVSFIGIYETIVYFIAQRKIKKGLFISSRMIGTIISINYFSLRTHLIGTFGCLLVCIALIRISIRIWN